MRWGYDEGEVNGVFLGWMVRENLRNKEDGRRRGKKKVGATDAFIFLWGSATDSIERCQPWSPCHQYPLLWQWGGFNIK